MGFNFRKSFKIAPGVKLNVSKKGISSISVGGKGVRVSAGRKGTRTTLSAPGTGLSYSSFKSYGGSKRKANASNDQVQENNWVESEEQIDTSQKKVSFLLFLGILLMPYIFAWFTLRKGHSLIARLFSFAWLMWYLAIVLA